LLPTDRFARTGPSRVEYIKVDERQSVEQALSTLRAEGYTISEDSLQRFGEFGVESICDASRYYLTRKAVDDLRYIRQIERKYRLERDRDGLALELAYRGYHSVPWERVHNSARKRVEIVLTSDVRGFGPAVWERFKGRRDGTIRNYEALLAAYDAGAHDERVKRAADELRRVVYDLKNA
jgi:hypothetical protein